MSKVPVDEARMILDTFKRGKEGHLEVQMASAWATVGLLEAQKENNMLLQAQNEILVTISDYLRLITAIQTGKEGWRRPE